MHLSTLSQGGWINGTPVIQYFLPTPTINIIRHQLDNLNSPGGNIRLSKVLAVLHWQQVVREGRGDPIQTQDSGQVGEPLILSV
jgi:hypothetical protein